MLALALYMLKLEKFILGLSLKLSPCCGLNWFPMILVLVVELDELEVLFGGFINSYESFDVFEVDDELVDVLELVV